MNGSATGVSVAGNVITANFSATYGALQPGKTIDLHFLATIGSGWHRAPRSPIPVSSPGTPATDASGSALDPGGHPAQPGDDQGRSGDHEHRAAGTVHAQRPEHRHERNAWNITLQDRLPVGATGGMCTTTPQIQSAQSSRLMV